MDLSENMVIDKNMDISAGKLNKHLDVSGIYVKKRGTVKNLKIREKSVMKGQVNISGNLNMKNRLFASSMVGMIGWFASENIPPGWLVCDGGKYTKALYTDLSNCIGNTYNAQDTDGDISFNVPDLTNQFVRSIYTDIDTDTDTDIRLGAKENYKTGKPTGDPNFNVTLSGEHIHNIQLSGSHSHDYEYNKTSKLETSYYINNSSTKINNKDIRDEGYLDNLTLYNNQNIDSVSASNFPVTLGDENANDSWDNGTINNIITTPPEWQNRQGDAFRFCYRYKYYVFLQGDRWSDWRCRGSLWENYVNLPTTMVLTNGVNRTNFGNKIEKYSYPNSSRNWYHDSAKDNYVRYKPDDTKNSDLNFINGSSTSNKDITFDKSGNHTHVVDDKENTHSHTLSNWDTESVPKHTILLPCIKY